jgi:hypothetical protein
VRGWRWFPGASHRELYRLSGGLMIRARIVFGAVLLAACGDLKFDENLPTAPGAPPPGSTTSLGSVSATVDNEQLTSPLQTPAIWRNDSFGFTGVNALGLTKILSLSLRLPGPGTYTTGGIYSPVVSYIEIDGQTTYRWFANFRQGSGSVTVSFLSNESASGYFSAELLADSTTMAAGMVEKRFVTGGVFNVAVIR